ncbi:unnamed protein product, partial [Cladocopium goreaui]
MHLTFWARHGRRFATAPVLQALRRVRALRSPSQLLGFAAKNEGAEMLVLYSVLQRLVSLLPKTGAGTVAVAEGLAGDGRFQVLMKTLSSRAEECNGATLARVADAAVRLRTRSPELEELLQRLAEVTVTRHNCIKPQDLSILAQAFGSWRLDPGADPARFLRGEALRQMQDFKWNSCVRFLDAFRRWGIVDPELTAMTLERLQDILPAATNRDVVMILEVFSKLGIARLELLQKLCQMAFSNLWLFSPQQLVSVTSSLAKLRFLTERDVEELLKALMPQFGRLSDVDVGRLLFALAMANVCCAQDPRLKVLAAQYVGAGNSDVLSDIDVAWALAVLGLDRYFPAMVERIAEMGMVEKRSSLVKLHDVLCHVAHQRPEFPLPSELRRAARDAAAAEAQRLASSQMRSKVLTVCHRLVPPQTPQRTMAGPFQVDFVDERSKLVVDLDLVSWPMTRKLRHQILGDQGYTTVALPYWEVKRLVLAYWAFNVLILRD